MSLRVNSAEGLTRAKRIELLFLLVFQFTFFFWIQLGFLAVFTTAFVLFVIATHFGDSSSNNPFGVTVGAHP